MNSDQVALIQHSFAKIRPIAQEAAALFYGRLFEIAPDVRPLFRGDMAEQGRKLMATLGVVVNGLTDLESILPAASALAKKHVSYGVRAEHYGPVGVARTRGRLDVRPRRRLDGRLHVAVRLHDR